MVTGIKIATIAVLLTNADAMAIENKKTANPKVLDVAVRELRLTTKNSRTPDFCKP